MKMVILNDTSYEGHHGCEAVVQNIKILASKNRIEVIDTNPTGVNWKEDSGILASISKCDIVLVNGEGTLHHAQPRAKELITVAKYVKETIGVPVVLINSTYQDNDNEMAECMRHFDLIYVRETLSKSELEKYNIQSKVVPDMSFYSKFDLSKKILTDCVGVTDSVNMKLSEKLFKLSSKKIYRYLPILTGPKIKINSVRNIMRYLKHAIFKNMKALLRVSGYKFNYQIISTFFYIDSYQDYIQQVSQLNFLIAARYHSLCFSLKTLTPFMAVELNSFRMKGILEDTGIGTSRIINGKDLSQLQIDKFSQYEVDKILTYVNNAPLEIELMFKEIKELLYK